MTACETQILALAHSQLWTYWVADIIAAMALIAAVWGGVAAYRNIRIIAEQLEIARWNSLLTFEQDMATRRTKFHELAIDTQATPAAQPQFLQERYDEAKESYFNSLDRLASSILRGHFPDAEMKQDYHDAITEVVRGFPADFDTGTRYRKIVRLYNRWQDQG